MGEVGDGTGDELNLEERIEAARGFMEALRGALEDFKALNAGDAGDAGDAGEHAQPAQPTQPTQPTKSSALLAKHAARVPNHGTTTEYTKYGCRCEACLGAIRAKMQVWRERRKMPKDRWGKPKGIPVSVIHGTAHVYTYWGCRCEACKRWKRVYMREWRGRKEGEGI